MEFHSKELRLPDTYGVKLVEILTFNSANISSFQNPLFIS